jgi:hypothetical protein
VTECELEEYRALRATIRERGTQRVWLAWSGLVIWSALTIGAMALALWPVATLVPLLVLAVTFECVFAIHTAVERVGRYLQVFYETDTESARGWEHQAMAFGQAFPGTGPDPLLSVGFALATVFNFIPVILAGALPVEYGVIGGLHVVFAARILQARQQAGQQRAKDLDRFQQLRQRAQTRSSQSALRDQG